MENRGIAPADKVVCLECGQLLSELNANGNRSHLRGRKHKMTKEEYKKKYPCARLTSFGRSADQNRRQGRPKTIQDLMDECAAGFLRPMELRAFVRDQEYEEHHEIKDFVVCRMKRCGMKAKASLHTHLVRVHGLTSATYRELFPNALQLPLGLYGAKNTLARTYGETKRANANIGGAVRRSEGAAMVVTYIVHHPGASNAETRNATETDFSDDYMTKLRAQSGFPGARGRKKGAVIPRTASGSFRRKP
jgi:predicted transcriptional regulator